MNKLRDMIFDFLEAEKYGVTEILKHWNNYKKEIQTMSKGKHTLYVGKDHQITFTIK